MPNPSPRPNPRPTPRPSPRAVADARCARPSPRRARLAPDAREPAPRHRALRRAPCAPAPRPAPGPAAAPSGAATATGRAARHDHDGRPSFVRRRAGHRRTRHRDHPGQPADHRPRRRPTGRRRAALGQVVRFRRRWKRGAFATLSVLTILALTFIGLGWRSYQQDPTGAGEVGAVRAHRGRNELSHRRVGFSRRHRPADDPNGGVR